MSDWGKKFWWKVFMLLLGLHNKILYTDRWWSRREIFLLRWPAWLRGKTLFQMVQFKQNVKTTANAVIIFLFFFLTKDEHKNEHKTIFKHRYLHALSKSATAEGIELLSWSGRVREKKNYINPKFSKSIRLTVLLLDFSNGLFI